jgi:hypothetical protein
MSVNLVLYASSGSPYAHGDWIVGVRNGRIAAIWLIDYGNPNTAGCDEPQWKKGMGLFAAIRELKMWVEDATVGCPTKCGYCAACDTTHDWTVIPPEEAIRLASHGRRWSKTILPITGFVHNTPCTFSNNRVRDYLLRR